MSNLYITVTNASGIINVNVNMSHSAAVAIATVECRSHSLNIGDAVEINLGYSDNHDKIFSGYVKQIDKKVPEKTFILTVHDVMTRALDYFIVSSNPNAPFTRSNISAEDLVEDLMAEASLTDFQSDSTSFRFATREAMEVNLVSAYDYSKSIADLLTWHLYADENGTVQFRNRKPHVMINGSPESSQPHFTADTPIVGKSLNSTNILTLTHKKSEKDLRNRIVIYGSEGVYATAQRSTSIDPDTGGYVSVLPGGYYKSAALATYIIQTTGMAQDTADYNLALMNRMSVELSATVIGDPAFMARRVVNVVEPILGINSSYYIYSAEHSFSNSGYTINMLLRR